MVSGACRAGRWLAMGGALALTGCSSLPFVGTGTGQITNPAVAACLRQADSQGLAAAGERQAFPTGEGRYTVVLDVRGSAGYRQVNCSYDPAKGAQIDATKEAGS